MAERLPGGALLEAQLLALKQSLRNRALRPGVGKATRAVAKAVKAATPEGVTKQLRRSIGSKVFTSRKRGVMGLVGAQKGFAVTVPVRVGRKIVMVRHDPTKILHIVEGGRKAVSAKPGKALLLLGRGTLRVSRVGKGKARTADTKGGADAAFRPRAGQAAGRHFLRKTWDRMRSGAQAEIWAAVEAWLAKAGA